jgi:hypothetical protein
MLDNLGCVCWCNQKTEHLLYINLKSNGLVNKMLIENNNNLIVIATAMYQNQTRIKY